MAESNASKQLGEELSCRLKSLGFDAGIAVYELVKVGFGLDLLKQALFDSTYREPVTVLLRAQDSEERVETPLTGGLDVVIEMAQAIYVPREPYQGSGHFGCWNAPHWYLRGLLYKAVVDPNPEVVRVHIYCEVASDDPGELDRAIVQVVRKPSGADPSTPLRYE